MSSKQLSKLEQLAGKRADQSRIALENEKQQLQQMERHQSELRSISSEYQRALMGGAEVAPQQLAQNRAFIEQLTKKLDELTCQSAIKRQSVINSAAEHQQRTAQHTAIEIVNNHRIEANNVVTSRRDQQQLDEAARGQHYEKNQLNTEFDNE